MRMSSRDRFTKIARLAANNFGDARLFIERFVSRARHVEVQIFGDGKGGIVALGERDCSVQRRNQKVVEETPAPGLSDAARKRLREAATALGQAVKYESAGTVEFLYDVDREEAYFLEVNTRLQVEHPVTEEIFGVDLVEWMIRQAAGEFTLPKPADLKPRGHAIELRLYAEDPARNFRPSTGMITDLAFAADARIETWIERGSEITSLYDPLLAKIVVKGDDRNDALAHLRTALDATAVAGIETNLAYLSAIAASPFFQSGTSTTASLASLAYQPARVEVVAPGTHSSLQDWPGRIGYWDVGIPPSGPMDDRSHRLVNRILGNAESAATLECTLAGPTLKFLSDTEIALGGAIMEAALDGVPVPYWEKIAVSRRPNPRARPHRRTGLAHLSRHTRRLRRAALSRLAIHLRARRLRRSRDGHDQGRRHAAHRQRQHAHDTPHRQTAKSPRSPTPGRSASSTARTARPTI